MKKSSSPRVHPGIVTGVQRLPAEHTKVIARSGALLADIRAMENYHFHNGGRILKFFLPSRKTNRLGGSSRGSRNPTVEVRSNDLKERERWGATTKTPTRRRSTRPPPRRCRGADPRRRQEIDAPCWSGTSSSKTCAS
ncbi:MAG: hypothetical protein R3F11_26460 [Verrucomicrobiales bacterium]